MATTIREDLIVIGNVQASGRVSGSVDRDSLITDTATVFMLRPEAWRVWDAYQTSLGSAASDDLGIQTGTFGTSFPYITSGDLNALGAFTRRARTLFHLPESFVSGQDIAFWVSAGMVTAVASVSCTLDVEIYKRNGYLTVTTDLVTSAAQSINSLSSNTYSFAVTGSDFEPGELLDIRLTLSGNSATASTHHAAVDLIWLELPVRG